MNPTRRSRMVGSIVDPAVDGDGLGLTGPGAPGTGFGEKAEHPVRARLLEKARMSGGAEPPASGQPTVEASPVAWSPVESVSTDAFPPDLGTGRDTSVAPNLPSPLDDEGATDDAPSESTDGATGELSFPLSEPGSRTPPPGAVASELDRIARRKAPSGSGPGLSPNMVAILGGLVGLTVISTLGVFLSRTEADFAATPQPTVEEKVEAAPEKKEAKVELPERKKLPGPWRVEDDATKPGHRVLKGKIGKDAFLRAIQDAGLPKGEAYRAYNALKDLKNLDRCKSSDTFLALVQGPEKSLVAFEYIVSKEEVYQAKTNEQGQFVGAKLDLAVERNQIRRAFTHDGNSFEESARRAGFDPGLSAAAEEALRGHASLSEFERGDRLRIIAQEVTVLGEFARYAGIEALEIVRPGKDPQRVYYYPHPVEGGYFDVAGKAPYEGGWRVPIPGAPVTSKFNMKRMHPVLNKVMPHTGTDFGAPTGTPIGSTAPGTVSYIGNAGPSGNLVKVKHDNGYESGYAHLSKFAEGLKVGDKVDRLQLVGYCGSTGRSTGPHLHFTMKKDGQFIDPESLNLDGMRVLPKAHREEFASVRAKYDPILDAIPLSEALAPKASAESDASSAAPAGMDMDAPDPGSDGEDSESADEGESYGMMEDESHDAPSPAPGADKPPSPAAPSMPAKAQSPSAIFLSDADLLKMQAATDDGEVNE